MEHGHVMSKRGNKLKSKHENPASQTDLTMAQPPVTLSQEQFQSLLAVLQSRTPEVPATTLEVNQGVSQQVGSFVNCRQIFSGAADADVEAFLNAILVYKDCANVSDANALMGFAFLLIDLAATWWNGIKSTVLTFDDAVSRLRSTFGVRKPPYKIYREIFSKEQDDVPTDLFICKIRELFAQLPSPAHPENVQIDMVY